MTEVTAARTWVGMWKTPSGLLITDQLPTATPCGNKMICRSRRSYPKRFPTPQLGALSLIDTSFVNTWSSQAF